MFSKPGLNLFTLVDKVFPGASRSFAWEFLCTAVSFFASLLLNRTLGATDRGTLALILLIPSIAFGIGGCQWDQTLMGSITSQKISSKEGWRRSVYYTYLLSGIVIPILTIGALLYPDFSVSVRQMIILYGFTFPFYFLTMCLANTYVAIGIVDIAYSIKVIQSVYYIASIFALVLSHHLSVFTVTLVYAGSNVIGFTAGLFYRKKLYGDIQNNRPSFAPLIQGFAPLTLEILASRLDFLILAAVSNPTILGQYATITALMTPVGIFSNSIASSSAANLDWTKPKIVNRHLIKVFILFLLVLCAIIIGSMLFGGSILYWLLGETYVSGQWMIPLIGTVVTIQLLGMQFHTALRLSGLQSQYLRIQTIESFFRFFAVGLLAWKFGERGIFWGMVLSSSLKASSSFICHYFLLNRETV